MSKILRFLIQPIRNNALFLLLLIVLTSAIEPYLFIAKSLWARAFTVIAYNLIECYAIVLLYDKLPLKIKGLFRGIVYILIVVTSIGSFVSRYAFDMPLNEDMPGIVAGSNPQETYEFILTFINPTIAACSIFFLLLPIAAEAILHYNRNKKYSVLSTILSLLLPISIIFVSLRPGEYYLKTFFKSIEYVSHIFQTTPDIKSNLENIDLNGGVKTPDNLIIIIGESFAKNSSQLYGYEKKTNPRLQYRKDSLGMITFSQVVSPAGNTIPCMKAIMSTWRVSDKDDVKWWECIALPEIMKKSGYRTGWISNQSKKGFWDNIPSKYSELCDTSIFTGNMYRGCFGKSQDEEVIPLLKSDIENNATGKDCYFIHLMGQHPGPENRYPEGFSKFKWEDYPDYPEYQRWYRFNNDNATLYNDYVVDGIMNLFEDKEAIIFYFPDHGLDIFEVGEYAGHGRKAVPESLKAGQKIPFMVYPTKLYREQYPDKIKEMERCADKPFNTENFMYTVMDVINVSFNGNNDVEKYSLFAGEQKPYVQ
ncbi:MAG: phosphoethanolamine transferase [Muribaculaceae bacterium]|nr:phosphoethanolamine transferase [Muribaculaceae bacterium]